MSKSELEKARKQLVAKRNDLVQNARQPLTKIQNEIIQYMVSKVKPTDLPGTKYTFKCSEFYGVMGYTTTSYTDVKALLSEIRKVNWWVDADVEGEDDKNLSWFNIVHMNPKKETVTISFHEDIEPYIFQLVENKMYFSSYPFQYISLMKSFYSQKLYEQLNTHKHDKPRPGKRYPEWIYEIGTGSKYDLFVRIAQAAPELDQRVRWDRKEKKTKVITRYDGFEPGQPMIPESWKNFAIFKRDVLEPAIKEINTYTDMMVMYEPLKTDLQGNRHRRYTTIRFTWLLKSEGQIEATEKLIDSEYERIEAARTGSSHQLTLDEVFGLQGGSSLESQMDKLQEEQDRYEADRKSKKQNPTHIVIDSELERRVDASDYPGATGTFGRDFNDDQLKFLFHAAFKNLPFSMLDRSQVDMWLEDYIGYYKHKLDETVADTRTKPYNRLLDMLKKDYDHVASMYAEHYENLMQNGGFPEIEMSPEKMPAASFSQTEQGMDDSREKAQSYLNRFSNLRSNEEGY